MPAPLLTHDYYPSSQVPFGEELSKLFFNPPDEREDFMIHGPNVVRLTKALLHNRMSEPGLLVGSDLDRHRTEDSYLRHYVQIQNALELEAQDHEQFEKLELFIGAAAMYHDIGKTIRRANHPQIGANLLRNFSQDKSNELVEALRYPTESPNSQSKHHRFSLICSTTQHHDKFGVVSTGEGALPIFSDILYFTSHRKVLEGILKNVTSVMLLNLGDIAAVVPGTAAKSDRVEAQRLAKEIFKARRAGAPEDDLLRELTGIVQKPSNCLGLTPLKVQEVLSDWDALVESIGATDVMGDRGRLKQRLLYLEQNPSRTIRRILRLLNEATDNSNAHVLSDRLSQTSVESVLVGALGSHEFQNFCRRFACSVKLDYALNFFKAIVVACTRKMLKRAISPLPAEGPAWNSLSAEEADALAHISEQDRQAIANHITSLFVKVLHGIITRYSGVLETGGFDPRRFGFQMRDLTTDKIREAIIRLLCLEDNKDHVALTWIADEVTIWSMD